MKRGISPVIAIVVLMLMTVSAAGMAYLTITMYQEEASGSAEGAVEQLASVGQSQIKIESISEGKLYVRSVGEACESVIVQVGNEPAQVLGDCSETQSMSVFNINSTCQSGYQTVKITTGGQTITKKVECQEIAGQVSGGEFTLTTFSDDSSARNVTFSSSSENDKVKIRIPKNATVNNAVLNIRGYPGPKIDTPYENLERYSWGVDIGDIHPSEGNEIVFGKYYNGEAFRAYTSNLTSLWSLSVTTPRGVAINDYNTSSTGHQIDEIGVKLPQGLDIGEVNDSSPGNELIIADATCIGSTPTICQSAGNDKVLVFSSDKTNLMNLTGFSCPSDVAIGEFNITSPGNEIIISDSGNNKVKIFTNTGTKINEITLSHPPTSVEIAEVNNTSPGKELIASFAEDGGRGFNIYNPEASQIFQKLIPESITGVTAGELNTSSPGNELVFSVYTDSCTYEGMFYKTHKYTNNSRLDIGSNLNLEWSVTGPYNETQQVPDFSTELNSYLSDCNCPGCTPTNGYCNIELNLTSDSAGIIELSNLQIEYT